MYTFIKKSILSLLITASIGLTACHNDTVDLSDIQLPYQSFDLYKDVINIDVQHIGSSLENIKKKYPDFTDFYLDTLLGVGFHGQYSDTNSMMDSLLIMKDYRNLLDTVKLAFPNTKKYDEALQKTFKYIKYYDSTCVVPQKIYYFVSYLNGMSAVIQNDQTMGIGLDMYLGRNYLPYQQLSIPAYATLRMTDVNIPVWAARAIFQDQYPFYTDNEDLLSLMIQKGKELFFLEKVNPFIEESLRMGFTKEQLEWCNKNQAAIYNYFQVQQLLYSKVLQKTMRYVLDGPSAVGMPPESPGNVGSYIGLQIIKAYADNSKASVIEILKEKDYQKIFKSANYKP
jgi:hypothetical protein